MNAFQAEIAQQPAALRDLVDRYSAADLRPPAGLPQPRRVVLTGMGASFHSALWASHLLQARGIWAIAVEASELLHFSRLLLEGMDCVVAISQSGRSAEMEPLLDFIPSTLPLIAVTNGGDSPLARRGDVVLPIVAGSESTVATKTYLNTLAVLWLLGQMWDHGDNPDDRAAITALAAAVEQLLADAERSSEILCDRLGPFERIFFVGHGPHVATARQGAMMMGEWLKRPAVAAGIGAFRHGLIEIADERCAVVLLGAGGKTAASVDALASELASYGTTVLSIVEGRLEDPRHPSPRRFDELLSPILDVVPMQTFIEALARRLEIAPQFRRIAKVITCI